MDFMYGLAELLVNDTSIGYIEDGSFDWGGQKGEVAEIKASQVKSAPVLIIPKSNGTIKPTFDLIQMNYANMVTIMGGKVKKTGEKVTGWEAPNNLVQTTGVIKIKTDSGHVINIPKGMISAYLAGNLNLDSVSKIKCELGVMASEGVAPYTIDDAVEDI